MSHSLDAINGARQDYADGQMSTEDICRKYAMSRGTLYYWLGGGPKSGERHLQPIPRRRGAATPRSRTQSIGDRVAIVRRMWRTAAAQVRDIERRLTKSQRQPEERERDARVLAVLVRTLRELSRFDETQPDQAASTDTAQHDDEVPRDIDEFRRELARRMDAFVERRTGAGVSGK